MTHAPGFRGRKHGTSTPAADREEIIEAKWRNWFDESIMRERASTIECCAKVADAFRPNQRREILELVEAIAAAIRALREKS